MSEIATYRGGLTPIYTRSPLGQRGSGFLSSLKRFLIPIGKAVLPSVFRGAKDLLSGKALGETVKNRAVEAGKQALGAVTKTAFGSPAPTATSIPRRGRKKRSQRGGAIFNSVTIKDMLSSSSPSSSSIGSIMEWENCPTDVSPQKKYKRRASTQRDISNLSWH